ncbi:four-carbon acid sugar kinase family protein, partial [Thioclava sp. BHET1]
MPRATAQPAPLPDGLLLTWYGDDFTGSAAVMEVLTFAGLPSALFLDIPTDAQRARFTGLRGLGIASTARAQDPAWMRRNLPPALGYLAGLDAPFLHYKICSTLDSAPESGNIGVAIEAALAARPSDLVPILVAAPAMRRYQAFGHLFAGTFDGVFRLDRHPVMSRHPVTPMTESDVLRHLSGQSPLPGALLDLEALTSVSHADRTLAQARAAGARLLSIDMMEAGSEERAGALLWRHRQAMRLLVGSQGVEYALLRHWQQSGALPPPPPPPALPPMAQIAAVSGSVSPMTAAQIDWSCRNGFESIRIPAELFCQGAAEIEAAEAATVVHARAALGRGQSPLILTATGPDDPAVAALRQATARSGLDPAEVNRRIGCVLGRVLDRLLRESG